MEDNNQKNTPYSVDDYYPKSSNQEDTSENCGTTEGESFSSREDGNDRNEEYGSGGSMTCPRCGNQVPSNMNFCSLCGYHFPKAADTPYPLNTTRIDGYLTDDITDFVGPNAPTYLRKFQRVSEGKISFNWAAAIFSNRWMAYRGMFRQAFFFSIIINAVSGVLSYLILSMFQSLGTQLTDSAYLQINTFSMALTVGVGLIVGLIGDSMYWKRTRHIMDQLSCRGREAVSNQRIHNSLRRIGGCKFGYAIVIILFDLSVNELITTLLSKLLGQA